MSKPKRALCFALVLVFAIGFGILQTTSPPDPIYQGKPEHVWLERLQQWSGDTNSPAFRAFEALGSNALPQLMAILTKKPSSISRLVNFINQRQSLIKLPEPKSDNGKQRVTVMRALYALGTNANPAYPLLTNMLFSPNQPPGDPGCAIALGGMGSKSIPILLQALTNQDMSIREVAVSGLGWERENIPSIIPPLNSCLNSPIRDQAFMSLNNLQAPTEKVVSALIAIYTNSDTMGRKFILNHIGEYGTNAQAAIPLIQSATNDPDPEIRGMAPSILNIIDPSHYQIYSVNSQ